MSDFTIYNPGGQFLLGSGLSVDPATNALIVASSAGGTVTGITAGTGLIGGTIAVSGTIALAPPTTTTIGGVKAGANVTIAPDGTLSVASPGVGTITAVNPGTGLTGGGGSGNVTLGLQTATGTQLGGIVLGGTLTATGPVVDVATATGTLRGGVLLASSAEVISGADDTKAVTPAGLAAKVATTSAPGLVQLSDSVSTVSSTVAATSTAVKTANDAAVSAGVVAGAALPRTGGVMTGPITFAAGQEFPAFALPIATTTSPGIVQVSSGLAVDSAGRLSTVNNGTLTSLVAGPGIGFPATGDTITSAGTIRLLPPSVYGDIGGVKAGTNISIAADGTIATTGVLQTNNPYAYNSYRFPAPDPTGNVLGENGSFLQLIDRVTGVVGWSSASFLSRIETGEGLTGGPITSVGTISLLPATSNTLGGIRPDNVTTFVGPGGLLTAVGGGGGGGDTFWGQFFNGDLPYLAPVLNGNNLVLNDAAGNRGFVATTAGEVYLADRLFTNNRLLFSPNFNQPVLSELTGGIIAYDTVTSDTIDFTVYGNDIFLTSQDNLEFATIGTILGCRHDSFQVRNLMTGANTLICDTATGDTNIGGSLTINQNVPGANITLPITQGAEGQVLTLDAPNPGLVQTSSWQYPAGSAPFQTFTTPSVEIDLDFAGNFTNWDITLGADGTLLDPANAASGQTGNILIRQDAVTPYNLIFGTAWKNAPTITPVAGAVDMLQFTVVAPDYIVVTNFISNIN